MGIVKLRFNCAASLQISASHPPGRQAGWQAAGSQVGRKPALLKLCFEKLVRLYMSRSKVGTHLRMGRSGMKRTPASSAGERSDQSSPQISGKLYPFIRRVDGARLRCENVKGAHKSLGVKHACRSLILAFLWLSKTKELSAVPPTHGIDSCGKRQKDPANLNLRAVESKVARTIGTESKEQTHCLAQALIDNRRE